jgi:PAS domain S-box-containing protein
LRLLEAAAAHMNDIVIITDNVERDASGNATITYVNDAFERITGFTRKEAIGRTPRILQGPKTQRAELDRIRHAVETKSPVRAELINYTKSGQEYWLELDLVPLENDAGLVTHFVAVQRDITDRRRAEEALRLSETRFRLVAEATGNAVWDWDITGGRVWWSDGMFQQFGHHPDPEGTLPTIWRANVHPDDEKRVDELLDKLLLGGIGVLHDRYRFRRADDTWAEVENHAFVIRDDEGRAIRVIGSMSDISHRLEMEDRLRQSQKLEAVGQLTGGVAHDFNNLLTIIIGNVELLQDSLAEDNPLRQFADMSAHAADRGAELTNRLLAFSRKQTLQPEVIDVNAVIGGIEDMLRRTLGENIDIQIELTDGLWLTEIDLAQVEASLLNLAINSRDAMREGGSLTIETANTTLDDDYVSTEAGLTAGDYVVIAVSDTGHGIPNHQIDRVFEPFFTTKSTGQGTGLGLSMVYGFVKQTGGHIRIYSEFDEGTTVKLYFPRYIGDHAAHGIAAVKTPLQRGTETILVVEDDALILQQLMAQLTGIGYEVVTASAGAPALDILRARPDIHLLLTDVVLPGGMNGRQIAEAAQAIRPGLKVLYTSGYSENAIVHRGRLDRDVNFLGKPYRRSELAAKVRQMLES